MAVVWYIVCFLCAFEASRTCVAVAMTVAGGDRAIRSTPWLNHAEEIVEKYGTDGNNMDVQQVDTLLKDVGLSGTNHSDEQGKQVCFSSEELYDKYSKGDDGVDPADLIDLCPSVLYQLTVDECKRSEEVEKEEENDKEEPKKAWGYGFLFVTIINLGSLVGAVVAPVMHKSFYKLVLMCMVSLAVGVLAGSGIFHLFPHSLSLGKMDKEKKFLRNCGMVVVGVYIFFVLECFMKLYLRHRCMRSEKEVVQMGNNENMDQLNRNAISNDSVVVNKVDNGYIRDDGLADEDTGKEGKEVESGQGEGRTIATVAWMIIIGDGLHNFIDGLAIGASFSTSVIRGVSTSLAAISEEVPHELGDFAILLSSGFTYKEAMLVNFLSACFCYIGLVVGIVVGYKTSSVKYIYGVAAGMFLYISLVDMLPEAIEMAYNLSRNSTWRAFKMLVLVNLSIILGFVIMLVLAIYENDIKV